jgi:ATP-dependent RNA helicase DOB1
VTNTLYLSFTTIAVIFTNTRKWDGKDFRYVTSGEYIQMSGRAGRRGKDDRGIVIQMLDEKMEPAVCKEILYGAADPLNSSYHISYNMLLNLMRVEDVDPEYLLRASFHQFQREKDAPGLLLQAETAESQAETVDLGSDEKSQLADEYYQMDQQLLLTRRKISKIVRKPEYVLKFLQAPGRFLDVTIDGNAYGWGVLASCKKKNGSGSGGDAGRLVSLTNPAEYTLEILLNCVDRHFDSKGKGAEEDAENSSLLWRGATQTCRPATDDDEKRIVSMRLFTVGLTSIDRLSAVRIFIPQDVTTPEARNKVAMSVKEVEKRFPEGIPLLDPIGDLGIKDEAFQTHLQRAEALTERLASHKLATDYPVQERLSLVHGYEKKAEYLEQAKAYREEARSCQTMAMKDDLKKMKRVLKRLGHVDAEGVIQTKGAFNVVRGTADMLSSVFGKVVMRSAYRGAPCILSHSSFLSYVYTGRTACEINTADELVVVELIFTGVFNDLSVDQCVALLSVMTFDERTKDDDDPTKGLKSFLLNPFYKLQEVARTVARVEIACGVDIDEDEFVDKFNPGM